ncbi:MAG: exosortase/archaeosortase family protein [Chloroflexota bacterium]
MLRSLVNKVLSKERAIRLLVIGLVLGLTLLVFHQPLRWLVAAWLGDPYYSHGFLVPLISAGLAWRVWAKHRDAGSHPNPRSRGRDAMKSGADLFGLGVVILALAVTAFAVARQTYFAAGLALPFFVGGVALYLRGWAIMRSLLFPIGYLVLMIPLPFVDSMALQLQIWTSSFSTSVANLLAVPAQQQGAAVSIPGGAYTVGLACSGLSSIIALLALGTLLAYLLDGRPWARIALIASVVPIAIVANSLRVSSLLWVAYRFGNEAGLVYHDTVAGFLSWALALGFLILESRLLRCRLNLVV